MAAMMVDPFETDDVDDFPEHASSVTQLEFLFRYTAHAATRAVGLSWIPLIEADGITFSMIQPEDRSARGRATLISVGAALAALQTALRRFGRIAAVHLFPDSARPGVVALLSIGEPQPPSLDDRLHFKALTAPTIRSVADEHRLLPQGLLHAAPHLIARDGVWAFAVAAASDRMRVRDCTRRAMQTGATAHQPGIAPITRDELVGPPDVSTPGLFLLGVKDHVPASAVALGAALQDLATMLRMYEMRARIAPMEHAFGEQVADALALPYVPQFMVLAAYEAPRL